MGYKDIRAVNYQVKALKRLNWLKYNEVTGYYLICSFNKLNIEFEKQSRAGIICYKEDVLNIYAFVGAAIFSYLCKSYWRKKKREKVVLIKGGTCNSFSQSSNFKLKYAPVATTGIKALFGISSSKASFLKLQAFKMGYIEVKKNFIVENISITEFNQARKYAEGGNKLLIKNGKVCRQSIDTILPRITLRKRQKPVT